MSTNDLFRSFSPKLVHAHIIIIIIILVSARGICNTIDTLLYTQPEKNYLRIEKQNWLLAYCMPEKFSVC